MAKVSREVKINQKPTSKQIKRLRELDKHDIVYDDEVSELSDAELMEFKPANPKLYKPRKLK